MLNVIKMDIYRLVTSLSFKVCIILVFVQNFISGPLTKLFVFLARKIMMSSDMTEQEVDEMFGTWSRDFHVGNAIASQLGGMCTIIFLLCVAFFSYSDIQHGYIKNIAGQLPRRSYTVISKFTVMQLAALIFYGVSVFAKTFGQLICGQRLRFDMVFPGELDMETFTFGPEKVFSLGHAFAEFAVKFLLLSSICALILLLTTGLGSNVAGTIAAVVVGAGFTGAAYAAASLAVNKLLKAKDFSFSDYMPDSLYRSDLIADGGMIRGIIAAVATTAVLLFVTIKLYDKKEIK